MNIPKEIVMILGLNSVDTKQIKLILNIYVSEIV